jgi:hypothetical protein
LSLLTALREIHTDRSAPRTGGTAAIDNWRQYCLDVAAAAEQLRKLAAEAAGKAEGSAFIAREIYGQPAPTPKARTTATMMLGCFAALEELRQRLASFANT